MMTVTLPPEVTDHLGLGELESEEGSGGSLGVMRGSEWSQVQDRRWKNDGVLNSSKLELMVDKHQTPAGRRAAFHPSRGSPANPARRLE